MFGRGFRMSSFFRTSVRTCAGGELRTVLAGLLTGALACGPRANIPPQPVAVAGALAASDSSARLARALSPVLYMQRDEWFPLERVVAVLHPTRRVIAYYMLWRDDVHGAWIPFTVPTDEEEVWVGYDSTGAPTDLWTYWHGTVLHTAWQGRQVAVAVQWGKHGSLPYGMIESDLPRAKTLNFFYLLTYLGEPDILLGDLTRPGPLGFFHSYRRYREFSRVLPLAGRIDLVARTADPRKLLTAVFGTRWSGKQLWPWTRDVRVGVRD